MTEDDIARQVFEILQEFAARINARLPGIRVGANDYGANIHGQHTPYAGAPLCDGDDELLLMFYLERTRAGLECRADFGTYRQTFNEMPACTLRDLDDAGQVVGLLARARDFAAAQDDRAVEELRRDRLRSRGP